MLAIMRRAGRRAFGADRCALFQGHEDYLIAARAACALPVIRKFYEMTRQCAEARAMGLMRFDHRQHLGCSDGGDERRRAAWMLVEVHDEVETR
jgi:indole-3-glycerol phosphate synthase